MMIKNALSALLFCTLININTNISAVTNNIYKTFRNQEPCGSACRYYNGYYQTKHNDSKTLTIGVYFSQPINAHQVTPLVEKALHKKCQLVKRYRKGKELKYHCL